MQGGGTKKTRRVAGFKGTVALRKADTEETRGGVRSDRRWQSALLWQGRFANGPARPAGPPPAGPAAVLLCLT